MEFSKILIIADYIAMAVLVILALLNGNITEIAIAWVAQVGVSSGFYFWKSRMENKTKIPMYLLKSLPKSMREEVNLTEIIIAIIQGE